MQMNEEVESFTHTAFSRRVSERGERVVDVIVVLRRWRERKRDARSGGGRGVAVVVRRRDVVRSELRKVENIVLGP